MEAIIALFFLRYAVHPQLLPGLLGKQHHGLRVKQIRSLPKYFSDFCGSNNNEEMLKY